MKYKPATVRRAEEYARIMLLGDAEFWRAGWEKGGFQHDVFLAVTDARACAHSIGETLGGVNPKGFV
jgi:hypothetical protein